MHLVTKLDSPLPQWDLAQPYRKWALTVTPMCMDIFIHVCEFMLSIWHFLRHHPMMKISSKWHHLYHSIANIIDKCLCYNAILLYHTWYQSLHPSQCSCLFQGLWVYMAWSDQWWLVKPAGCIVYELGIICQNMARTWRVGGHFQSYSNPWST